MPANPEQQPVPEQDVIIAHEQEVNDYNNHYGQESTSNQSQTGQQ